MSDDMSPAMTDDDGNPITVILQEISNGNKEAWSSLLAIVYDELRAVARARLSQRNRDEMMQSTELVNEAYIRLTRNEHVKFENRRHFFGAAARCICEILIEEARKRERQKRGGDWNRISLTEGVLTDDRDPVNLIALHELLDELKKNDPFQHEIVMLRYFCGLSIDDVARMTGRSPATIDRHWSFARAWLRRELKRGQSSQG